MQIILSFFIGLQIMGHFFAAFYGFKTSRMDMTNTFSWTLFSLGCAINCIRRIQVICGVNLLDIGLTANKTAISVDTIVVQTVISILFMCFSVSIYSMLKKKYG